MSVSFKALRLVANVVILGGFLVAVPEAYSATIAWTDWTSAVGGNPGSATGTIALSPALTVSYAGQISSRLVNYPSWAPASTFSGGSVSNAPPASDNSIQLVGGTSATNTITFSSPVTDPIMAIWSLGASSASASFVFTASEPFTLESGGPSAEYGGRSVTASGDTVTGSEGNGVIQFSGTFSTLTWTNPSFENYYAFTVGVTGAATPAVPEPSTLVLLCMPLLALLLWARRRSDAAGNTGSHTS